jgi:hypothetical protein
LDQFIGILIFLIWMAFNVYRASQKAKAKQQESAKTKPEEKQKPVQEEKSFREILEEIRRAAEAAKKKEAPVQPAPVRQVKQVKTETVSEREKKKQLAYERFVEAERKAEHDAAVRNLDEKILHTVDTSDRKPVVVNLNLRNIIISDAILNRPYK